jgi:uncharacterized C2H2 Zn-finger protein
MSPVTCEQCGREFKNDLAMKIHAGRLHGSKSRRKAGRRKAGRAQAAAGAEGGITCSICGRSFALPLHLGRHMAASHGKAKVRRARAGGRAVARRGPGRPPAGQMADVRDLSVDQLLGLKVAVDARLAEIARRMRQARVGV